MVSLLLYKIDVFQNWVLTVLYMPTHSLFEQSDQKLNSDRFNSIKLNSIHILLQLVINPLLVCKTIIIYLLSAQDTTGSDRNKKRRTQHPARAHRPSHVCVEVGMKTKRCATVCDHNLILIS